MTTARTLVAGLLLAAMVMLGAGRATAAPGALVPPLRPIPTEAPALGGAPCLPIIGCNPLGGLGEEAANVMARAVINAFVSFVADGVKTVLQQVSAAIGTSTEVKLDRDWFTSHAAAIRGLAVVVLLPLMLVGLISAVIHRDPGQLLRAGGVYVPVAIVGGAAAVVLTDTALKVTDALTSAVTGDMAANSAAAMGALRDAIAAVSSPGTIGAGTMLAITVMLVLLAGALLIWIELLLRTSAIYVVVLFLPLAMSGLVWRATVSWTRRMIEILVALILSKFVIVVIIDLAAGMIVANDGIGTILQGATLMLLAACAPFALLRLIPLAEAGVISHLEGMERRPVAVATQAATGVARQAVGGVETATAGHAVSANGGDAYRMLANTPTEGGELSVDPPEGWSPGAGGPRRSAELVGAGPTRAPGPADAGGTGTAPCAVATLEAPPAAASGDAAGGD
jgi:type IV secretion system protein TrbL